MCFYGQFRDGKPKQIILFFLTRALVLHAHNNAILSQSKSMEIMSKWIERIYILSSYCFYNQIMHNAHNISWNCEMSLAIYHFSRPNYRAMHTLHKCIRFAHNGNWENEEIMNYCIHDDDFRITHTKQKWDSESMDQNRKMYICTIKCNLLSVAHEHIENKTIETFLSRNFVYIGWCNKHVGIA